MVRVVLLLWFLVVGGGVAVRAQAQAPDAVPGILMAMLVPNGEPRAIAADITRDAQVPVQVDRCVSMPMRTWTFRFDPDVADAHGLLRILRAHPAVQLAQFDHYIHERSVPDDPLYGSQWHHARIQSEAAWDVTRGGLTFTGDTIVVCIIERVDLTHPDLAPNAWVNHAEIPGNGIDDDGNGYVDDHRGWHVTAGNDDIFAGPHGTRVAGLVGAKGNNALGVVGANWDVKMMVVHYGTLNESNVVAAYTYPWEMRRRYNQSGGAEGAFVVATNASWGINNGQPDNYPIWCAVYDSLGAQGVLSCGSTTNSNVNVDVVGDMPTACTSEYLVSVTATNSDDMRSGGYGAVSIDVAAPGSGVYTTNVDGTYGSASGTSFAAPLTAGVIGLLYSAPCPSLMDLVHSDPAAAARHVRDVLFAGVEQVGNLPGTIATGGRINAHHSMQALLAECTGCPPPFMLQATNGAIGEATLTWGAVSGDLFTVRYRELGGDAWTTLTLSAPPVTITGLLPCTAYEFQVAAQCAGEDSGFGLPVIWTSEGCCHAPLTMAETSITDGAIDMAWGTVLAAAHYDLRWRELDAAGWNEVPAITMTEHALTDLAPCAGYVWQVRAVCAEVASPWTVERATATTGCGACVELDYCPSTALASQNEWIQRFVIGGVERVTGNDGGYGDHTGVPAVLHIGASEPFVMEPGFQFAPFTEWTRIWVDLDRDGTFNDDDELLFDPPNGSNTTLNGSITIPADALPGITRLRVSMRYGAHVESGCTPSYNYGETEDHCVDLRREVGLGDERERGPEWRVYPQPAADQAVFHRADGAERWRVLVFDAAGRVVDQLRYDGVRHTYAVGHLAPGMYTCVAFVGERAVARVPLVVAR